MIESKRYGKSAVGLAAAAILLSAAIAGCGGKLPAPAMPSLSVSPATLTAGAAATTFIATLLGSTDTVAWSLTGAGSLDGQRLNHQLHAACFRRRT
jgi:ABC-type branched-subunit amino acid transport system permease subunit